MLLANRAVAKKLLQTFPTVALLRSQEPPKPEGLSELSGVALKLGYTLKAETSKDLHISLQRIDDPLTHEIISLLSTMTMRRAKYICAKPGSESTHYALNEESYTHFTSPIRRYSDIVVHRLLDAAIRGVPSGYTPSGIVHTVEHINEKSREASLCEDAVRDVYLTYYLQQENLQRTSEVTEEVFITRISLNNTGSNLSVEGYSPRLGIDRPIHFLRDSDQSTKVSFKKDLKNHDSPPCPLGTRPASDGVGPTFEVTWKKGGITEVMILQRLQRVHVHVLTKFSSSPPTAKFVFQRRLGN